MKITKTNNNELYIGGGGYGALIAGSVLVVGGAVALLFSLNLTVQNITVGRLFAGGFLLVGLVLILTASKRELFLRRSGTSEVRSTNLVFHRVRSVTFAADQVEAVGFETHDEYSGANSNGTQTRNRESSLWLTLKDTTQIPLLSVTKSANNSLSIGGVRLAGAGRAPLYDEATTIADFYSVPLQARAATGSLPTDLGVFADSARRMMNGSSQPSTQEATFAPTAPQPPAQPQVAASLESPSLASQPVVPAAPVAPVTPVTVASQPTEVSAPERANVQVPPRN